MSRKLLEPFVKMFLHLSLSYAITFGSGKTFQKALSNFLAFTLSTSVCVKFTDCTW